MNSERRVNSLWSNFCGGDYGRSVRGDFCAPSNITAIMWACNRAKYLADLNIHKLANSFWIFAWDNWHPYSDAFSQQLRRIIEVHLYSTFIIVDGCAKGTRWQADDLGHWAVHTSLNLTDQEKALVWEDLMSGKNPIKRFTSEPRYRKPKAVQMLAAIGNIHANTRKNK